MKKVLPVVVIVLAVTAFVMRDGGVTVPDDNSLSDASYVQRGVPAIDGLWSADDYRVAAAALKGIASSSVTELPRYNSRKSGRLFARMTNPENLNIPKNSTDPLLDRAIDASEYWNGAGLLLQLYVFAGNKEIGAFDYEVVELSGMALWINIVTFELSREYVASLSTEDPGHKTFSDALAEMRAGMTQSVDGTLTMLGDEESLRPGALIRLTSHLKETLPGIMPELASAAQSGVSSRLQTLIDEAQDEEYRAALVDLKNSLHPPAK